MFVYEDGFRCASCGKRGSLAYLDKQLGSHFTLTRSQAQASKPQVLPRWKKWEEQHGSLEGIANYAHKSLLKFPQFQSYFKKRKIYEHIEKGIFGYIDGYAIFPVINRDRKVIDIVTRTSNSRNGNRYSVSPLISISQHPLYSPDWRRIEESNVVYVVFGIIDSWTLESLGLPCLTGTTGKSLSPELLKPLNKKFIIIPDDGEEREAYLLANKLGWRAKVKSLHWDDECKDVDDERVKFGNQHLLQLIGA